MSAQILWPAAGPRLLLFAACLIPILLLASAALEAGSPRAIAPELTANPIEYITHYTGDWTIRFLLITL